MVFLRCKLAFTSRHSKEVEYKTFVRLFGIPIMNLKIGQVEKVQRTAARWTCRSWRNTSSVGDNHAGRTLAKCLASLIKDPRAVGRFE